MPEDPDSTTQLGGWLFRHRTALPLPFAAAILGLRIGQVPSSGWLIATGVAITLAGEALRMWGVHHIGAISRTRADRLGPLIETGPFAWVRNPLYLGNIALWVGFAIAARLVWLAPVILVLLGLEYHAIVRWEEQLLESRRGEAYREYASRVARWTPRLFNRRERRERREKNGQDISAVSAVSALNTGGQTRANTGGQTWNATLFSERGTLLAIAAGYLLLYLKARF